MTGKLVWLAAAAMAGLGMNAALAQPAQPPAQTQPASAPAQPAAEGVAAIVNDEVISTYDVRQRAFLILLSAGIEPTADIMQRAQAQATRELIDESLQLQETKTFDISITDQEIDRRLNDIARANQTTPDGFTQQLNSAGVGVATLRRQIQADMAWNRLINGLYGQRVRISEQQVSDTQARLIASAQKPHYLISEIFLPGETTAEIQDLQRGAMTLLQQMQQGVPFPSIARQFSAAPSAAAGGDIGWIASGELPPEVERVLTNLQPGQVSVPVATQTGVYIVALRDKRAGSDPAATSRVSLQQVSAPASARAALERAQRRISNCENLQSALAGVDGAEVVDLGDALESDLSPSVRGRIANVQPGSSSSVEVAGDNASLIVVCSRQASMEGLPSREQLSDQLRENELALLAERYLRNLRREATIITR